MRPQNKFWWFAAISIGLVFSIIIVIAVVLWHALAPGEKEVVIRIFKNNFGYIFAAAFLLIAGIGFLLDGIFHIYILPLGRLIEETGVITTVNAAHRIKIEGSRDIMTLARIINEGANRFEAMERDVRQRIQMAKLEVEEEKNILATFMGELPQGVLICNREGTILFYNKKAREYLQFRKQAEEEGSLPQRFIGLGRSIFGVIDKPVIVHALDEIGDRLKRNESNTAAYFVLVGSSETLLSAEAVPVLNERREFSGFVLILRDITRRLQDDRQMESILRSLNRRIRAHLAGIRSAIETIMEYPDMESGQLARFRKIIHNESIQLGRELEAATGDYFEQIKGQWPLVQMSGKDLLRSIRKKAGGKLEIAIEVMDCEEDVQVRVDSYSFVLAVLFVIEHLRTEAGAHDFKCSLYKSGRFVNIDFNFNSPPVRIETLRKWDNDLLVVQEEGIPLTLGEVIRYHGADLWSYMKQDPEKRVCLRFFLPAVEQKDPENVRRMTIVSQSRPAFYDFDMFNRPDQDKEMDDRPLSELIFTVFDTETTGLDPRGGDEIISIGAVRVVNLRLLEEEMFDQLVDPGRPVPYESTKIHGITTEMVNGQPEIGRALDLFHRFSEDTVLVAHNAAFDMLMLQLKEEATGISFHNPVLDTMLLSAVVHPIQKDHNIEGLSKRLGISIMGRHTALGDAIATAEIFLKLIPLLEKQGIRTLKEARAASRKTYYARLKY